MNADTARNGDVVLVVEDDASFRGLLRHQLTSAGYAVEEACDGVEALESLNAREVTAIIVDLKMPRLDGHGLCRAVRSREGSRHLPIVILSGLDQPDDINDLIELGHIRYVRKGADDHGLLRSLRLLIESASAPAHMH